MSLRLPSNRGRAWIAASSPGWIIDAVAAAGVPIPYKQDLASFELMFDVTVSPGSDQGRNLAIKQGGER